MTGSAKKHPNLQPHTHTSEEKALQCVMRHDCDRHSVAPEPGQVWIHETDGTIYVCQVFDPADRSDFRDFRGRRRRPTLGQIESNWHFLSAL